MPVTRVRGNLLTLSIGATEYSAEFASVMLQSEDAADDVKTFGSDNSDWFMTLSGITSLDAASFWRYCWQNASTDVAFILRPLGNATESADAPHFKGTVRIPERGRLPIMVDSNPRSTSSWDGIRFDIIGDVTLDATA
jgi:hypothetical protein